MNGEEPLSNNLIEVFDCPPGSTVWWAFDKALFLRPKCRGVIFNGQFYRICSTTILQDLENEFRVRTNQR